MVGHILTLTPKIGCKQPSPAVSTEVTMTDSNQTSLMISSFPLSGTEITPTDDIEELLGLSVVCQNVRRSRCRNQLDECGKLLSSTKR